MVYYFMFGDACFGGPQDNLAVRPVIRTDLT